MLLLGHDEDRVCYWRLASHRAKAKKMTAQWWGYRIYGGITSQQALPDASISLIWFSLSCLPTLLLPKHNRLNAEDNRHTRGQRPIYHLANLKARALWLLRRSRQSSGSSSCLSPPRIFFSNADQSGNGACLQTCCQFGPQGWQISPDDDVGFLCWTEEKKGKNWDALVFVWRTTTNEL